MRDEEYERRESVIKVIDRRRFHPDGQARDQASAPDRAKPTVSAAAEAAASTARERAKAPVPSQQAKKNDFLPFVANLATNAMAAMGALPQARERGMPVDPQMAREYIDIILMLQERTVGNLTAEEDTSLRRLVGELQRGYAEATGAVSGAAALPDELAAAPLGRPLM